MPLPNNSYILTSNRDESPNRPAAIAPRKYRVAGKHVFYPKDPQASGTWIATCENNYTLCLLNGAFESHVRKEPYRLSRGLMVLDFFKYNSVHSFIELYDFQGIEPFTLIIVDTNKGLTLHELRWDGLKLHTLEMDTTAPHIWSSATLYESAVRLQREKWFSEWLQEQNGSYTIEQIIRFHTFGGEEDSNSLVMNRNNVVKTLSITSIERHDDNYRMSYSDILADKTTTYRILQSEKPCI